MYYYDEAFLHGIGGRFPVHRGHDWRPAAGNEWCGQIDLIAVSEPSLREPKGYPTFPQPYQ